MESDGRARIRFGDDEYGKRPNPGTAFFAHYRIGNGVRGNIGPDAIAQIVTTLNGIESATNVVPAWGGRRPETIDEIRQRAPVAFRTQQRAVTPEDYAATVERHPGVQRAVATIQWTGSWRTIFITVDRAGGLEVDQAFEDELRISLERFRMAGHDVEIQPPVLVPIEIEMTVCVAPDHFRSDVKAALLDVFSTRVLPDGRRGAFHPDELTFGQSIYLSRLYSAAQAVDGVTSVEITVFQRQGIPGSSALETGELKLGRTEIASLANSASFPDRGVLRITLGGGK
jgi:predicted phage baseplate assembly protein